MYDLPFSRRNCVGCHLNVQERSQASIICLRKLCSWVRQQHLSSDSCCLCISLGSLGNFCLVASASFLSTQELLALGKVRLELLKEPPSEVYLFSWSASSVTASKGLFGSSCYHLGNRSFSVSAPLTMAARGAGSGYSFPGDIQYRM